jgi:3-hydroxyacyl-CoA dehydrogenase/enoyl-CoA hydratase/3-hydroxybutyryl-CoA epimerase
VIILSDKKSFLVGADIHGMYREVLDAKLGETAARRGQSLFDRLAALPIPTIAAINAMALGGGLELALACSYRVLSANGRVGLPEVKLGLLPGAGGTVRTPKLIGLQAALQLILPGGTMDANNAKKRGLVDHVVGSTDRFKNEDAFRNEAIKFAQTRALYRSLPKRNKIKYLSLQEQLLNSNSFGRKIVAQQALANLDKQTGGRYPAPYLALDSIYNATHTPNQRALMVEAENFGKLAASPESKNLISIFFMSENAKKIYKPDRLPHSTKDDVQQWLKEKWINGKVYNPTNNTARYGIIGAGVMGAGIGQLIISKLQEGNTIVYLKDIKDEFVQKGMKFIQDLLKKRKKEKLMKFVIGGTDDAELAKCDIVIEAALEKMEIKKKILQGLESDWIKQLALKYPDERDPQVLLQKGGKIFCTNTSTLSVTEIASVSKNPSNVVGLHFFNPVHRMPLVEIIRGKETSDETVVHCYNLSLLFGKTPIVVNDGPGFLVNRVLGVYLLEAQRLMNEGYNIQQVDVLVKNFGMPMGPYRLLDEVGADVALHSADTLKVLGNRFQLQESNNTFPLGSLVAAGYLGKKTGAGIYDYKQKKDALSSVLDKAKNLISSTKPDINLDGLNTKLLQVYPNYKGRRTPGSDIMDRMVLIMINEAVMILQEGIATSPEDVDIGMIFGTGFCPFRGGLLSYADQRGLKIVVKKLQELQNTYGDRFAPCELLLRMAQNDERFFPDRVPAVVGEFARPPRPRL